MLESPFTAILALRREKDVFLSHHRDAGGDRPPAWPDLSHYSVAGEMRVPAAAAQKRLDVLMERAVMLDGRVSNGEQVQIDMGPAADNEQTKLFAGLWKKVMIGWLQTAKRGDLFPTLAGGGRRAAVGLSTKRLTRHHKTRELVLHSGRPGVGSS